MVGFRVFCGEVMEMFLNTGVLLLLLFFIMSSCYAMGVGNGYETDDSRFKFGGVFIQLMGDGPCGEHGRWGVVPACLCHGPWRGEFCDIHCESTCFIAVETPGSCTTSGFVDIADIEECKIATNYLNAELGAYTDDRQEVDATSSRYKPNRGCYSKCYNDTSGYLCNEFSTHPAAWDEVYLEEKFAEHYKEHGKDYDFQICQTCAPCVP